MINMNNTYKYYETQVGFEWLMSYSQKVCGLNGKNGAKPLKIILFDRYRGICAGHVYYISAYNVLIWEYIIQYNDDKNEINKKHKGITYLL